MSHSFNEKPYASGHLRALLTMVFLALNAGVGALSLIVSASLVGTLRDKDDPTAVYEFGESLTEALYVLVNLLRVVLIVMTAVVFLMWLHRAYRNLPALGARNLDTTPGWAVGYFFIPFANLVKPFQVVREVWRKSEATEDSSEGFISYQTGTPALVGWWWAFWIIANIAGRVSSRVSGEAETVNAVLAATWVGIVSDALIVIAAVLAIFVVKRIDEMQEAKARQIGTLTPPPPPENFDNYRTI
jgi:hypothetical protein